MWAAVVVVVLKMLQQQRKRLLAYLSRSQPSQMLAPPLLKPG
jgi:hypothetical protein